MGETSCFLPILATYGGDPCRTRTCNQLIKSQLLCQIELTGRVRRYYTLKVRLVNLQTRLRNPVF